MKITKKILGLTAAFALMLGLVAVVPSTVSANALQDGACNGINTVLEGGDSLSGSTAAECGSGAESDQQITSTINSLINLFSIAVGAVSVIMIIYGGFKYITSGGSDDSTKAAKNTILYALVGLVIVLLAQTIVKFVFGKAIGFSGGE